MRLTLVNMPFSSLRFPSFAVSQLRAVVEEQLGERCEVQLVYANHEFARAVGVERYELLASPEFHASGVGEWIFREAAFPEAIPNAQEYYDRYFPGDDAQARQLRAAVAEVRRVARAFCEELAEDPRCADADVVGFTSLFAQIAASTGMARAVRAVNPGAVLVVGGANTESPMGEALAEAESAFDYVFSGPALRSFPQFLSELHDGNRERCGRIPGVIPAGVEPAGAVPIVNRGVERPINDFVDPIFVDFRREFDETFQRCLPDPTAEPVLFFETSRGCWWGAKSHCKFCGLNSGSMTFRELDADLAVRHLQDLVDQHYPWCKRFHCVDNILPQSYMSEVLPRLEVPGDVEFFYEVKVGKLKDPELRTLAGAGVTALQPGIEALSTATLKLMGKGTTSFQNIRFLLACKRFGIRPLWSILVGFPGEEASIYQGYLDAIPRLRHLPAPMGVFRVRFDRYSPYYEKAQEFGLELEPLDYYRLTFAYPPQTLADLAYYFADLSGQQYIDDVLEWQPAMRVEVQEWRSVWGSGRAGLALHREAGEWVIRDTRSGSPSLIPVTAGEVDVLERLIEPARIAGSDLARDLVSLREKGLIFEESDRAMSLVEGLESIDGARAALDTAGSTLDPPASSVPATSVAV